MYSRGGGYDYTDADRHCIYVYRIKKRQTPFFYPIAIASAVFIPSTAAEVIPPA